MYMSWLEQIRTKRAERNGPQNGKAVFANYEFTEDRREQAARARQEPAVASNIFDNARRELTSERATPAMEEVQKVRFEGDVIDPDASGEKQRRAPRRSARRIRAPIDLYYFTTPDHFVPLELTVIYRDGGTRALDCFLYDVSDSGIGFAAPGQFPEGSELTILGAHAEDMTPLIATDVTIVNNRRLPEGKPMPEKFLGRDLWLHGTRMEIHDALLLYKAALDSIALSVALQGGATEHAAESDEGGQSEPADLPAD